MAYIPTEWATGDVITAAKLNNMEQGIEDAFVAPAVTVADEGDVLTVNSSGEWAAAAPESPVMVIHGTIDTSTFMATLDKTFSEIKAAMVAGKYCPVIMNAIEGVVDTTPGGFVNSFMEIPGEYTVVIYSGSEAKDPQDPTGSVIALAEYYKTTTTDGYPSKQYS